MLGKELRKALAQNTLSVLTLSIEGDEKPNFGMFLVIPPTTAILSVLYP